MSEESEAIEWNNQHFKMQMRRSRTAVVIGSICLIVGIPLFGLFTYVLLTQFTDDVTILFSPSIFLVIGATCITLAIFIRKNISATFPDLWESHFEGKRKAKK